MFNNRKSSPKGAPGQRPLHRLPEVAEQPTLTDPQESCRDEQTDQQPDLKNFKVFMKRNLPYQDIPEGAMDDLRARIAEIKNEQ